jgi:hypothetical protein
LTISDLGSIGEFVSAIGVVASLIYVGLQIRSNTEATRSATRQALSDQDLMYVAAGIDSSILAEATAKLEKKLDVSPAEASQLVQHQHLNLRIAENAFYQFKRGRLEEVVWDRYLAILGLQMRHNPYAIKQWSHYRDSYSRDFQIVVDEILERERLADMRGDSTTPDRL